MVEKGNRDGICQVLHRYAKENNKYTKSYDKSIESSYLMYLDPKNFYGWTMSQRLPENGFEWANTLSKVDEHFIKSYDDNSDKGYFFEVDVEYQKNFHNLQSDLPFLPARKKIEKCNKFVYDFNDKNYVVIITLNQSIKTEQNYVTWILTALLFILKLKIFMKTLLVMLKDGLIHLTMMRMMKDRFP